MIRYDLVCDKGHQFDGWFRDSAGYDNQRQHELVACAHCGSVQIDKQIMAPRIGVKSNAQTEAPSQALPQAMMTAPVDPRMQAMMTMMREMRKHVEANSENVGDKFVDEARKQHYNEVEKRGIYGDATADHARALLDEGIEIYPLPRLPEDGN
jgi:hypothetical protein